MQHYKINQHYHQAQKNNLALESNNSHAKLLKKVQLIP